MASGNATGCVARTPSKKRLTVFLFWLFASKLIRTPTVWPRAMRFPLESFFLSQVVKPSASKQMLSSVSPKKSEEPCVATPTFMTCLGMGAPRGVPEAGSVDAIDSKMVASKRYLPLFTPTLARAPAMRYCKPPSVKVASTRPPWTGTTLRVQSQSWKPTFSFNAAAFLPPGSSTSSSLGGSSFASSLTSSPSIFLLFASCSAMACSAAIARKALVLTRREGRKT
mmetsp:Transcript_91055/g.256631  ORF Transcript_91055/g.256631 Transcript_91055/m.256631 type:complete len:225 (+) Transcript_91055:224-898(+)